MAGGSGAHWQADVVVGIDFGMTCTGVAWSSGPTWGPPNHITNWPGLRSMDDRKKVRSVVSYGRGTGRFVDWGFKCPPSDDANVDLGVNFKTLMDPSFSRNERQQAGPAEAQRWYVDYLRKLREYLVRYFEGCVADFQSKSVDYIFSVPVSWFKNGFVGHLNGLLHDAGFGQRFEERYSVYMTEAEAAAVYCARQSMYRGDVLLVVDAGGSTTDTVTLKVEENLRNDFELRPLTWQDGDLVGSQWIDCDIRRILETKLKRIPGVDQYQAERAAMEMVSGGNYESYKCGVGDESDDVDLFLRVPGLAEDIDIPEAEIFHSTITVTRDEFKHSFDSKITKLYDLIDAQLLQIRDQHPRETVSKIVLSGGFGKSTYVRSCLKKKYQSGHTDISSVGGRLELLLAVEPQRAVVEGMIIRRTRPERGQHDPLAQRFAPISYGILSRQPWDIDQHQGRDNRRNPIDQERWSYNQIEWLIKKGHKYDVDHTIRKTFQFTNTVKGMDMKRRIHVVSSHLKAEDLPPAFSQGGSVEKKCTIECNIPAKYYKPRNHHFWNLSPPYYQCIFDILVICGMEGIRFEIPLDNQQHCQQNMIEVHWISDDGMEPTRSLGYSPSISSEGDARGRQSI